MKPIESGKVRLLFLILYLGFLFVANRIAFSSWIPTTDKNSLWFGAGVLSLLLSSFLVTPYFERPANHIASAVAAFVACCLAFDWSSFEDAESFIAKAILVYLLLVVIVSACALLLRSRREGIGLRAATTAKELSDQFGNDRILFSIEGNVEPPVPFNVIHTNPLINWGGTSPSTQFDKIVEDLKSILGPPPVDVKEAERKAEEERKQKEAEAICAFHLEVKQFE